MSKQYNKKKTVFNIHTLIFIIRNLILFYLAVNSYIQFKNDLDFLFIIIAITTAVLISLLVVKTNFKPVPSVILFLIIPFILRIIIFFIINIIISIQNTPRADLLFLFFDNNFYPALIPWFIICLFNYLSLQFNKFIRFEIILNILILLIIFITEINYHIKLMHPTVFAVSVCFFIFLEILLLYLINKRELKTSHSDYRQFLIYIPLLLLVLIFNFSFVISEYNKGIVQTTGGLLGPTLFRFDFTSYLTLQNEIEQSGDLVMIYRKNGTALKMLIRRFVLSEYIGLDGFIQASDIALENLPLFVPDSATEFEDPGYIKRTEINQEYFIVNFDPNSLMALNYPVKSIPIKNWDSSSFIRIFSVDSKISTAEEEDLKKILLSDMNGPKYNFYTDYDNDKLIKELAVSITEGKTNYYDRVTALRDYLRYNYYYSQKPGIAEDGNQLHHFLFRNNHRTGNGPLDPHMRGKGYCSYFAFAMTLMARSIGIPARVAVGFLVFPDSSLLNFYEIREYQAHAWVEIYFNEYGWIEFDPTSGIIAPGEEFVFPPVSDRETLTDLIEEILSNELIEDKTENKKDTSNNLEFIKSIIESIQSVMVYWYFIIPVFYILLLVIINYLHYLYFKISGSICKKIKHLFYYTLKLLKNCNIRKLNQESLTTFSIRIKNQHNINIGELTGIYLKSVFAESVLQEDLKRAFNLYTSFYKDYRKNINTIKRIAGIFNPLGLLK
jgi:protein-glutamine gamma-glutamyltransferase